MTRLVVGDCRDVVKTMDAESVDAVVTDPPYGLGFMGKEWDDGKSFVERKAAKANTFDHVGGNHNPVDSRDSQRTKLREGRAYQLWCEQWATECVRVLKPGGYLLAFGGTRTYHRLTCGIEDAGFEIRDSVLWLYGSGFPKSLDVSKAIDKAAGAEREVVGHHPLHRTGGHLRHDGENARPWQAAAAESGHGGDVTAPATPDAERWQGWGTALKPAHEPIVVARKPLQGTVAQNVLEHGTGALNVDGCRIGTESTERTRTPRDFGLVNDDGWTPTPGTNGSDAGRWPANVVLDETTAELLDEQSGEGESKPFKSATTTAHREVYSDGKGVDYSGRGYDDTGGASRFFYVAKASRAERNAGLGSDPVHLWTPENQPERNSHPTVKPIALMRYLVRLVTPPGGLVLDPFVGSGTTGIAAALEGLEFIGIDQEREYVDIAHSRLAHWATSHVEVVA